MKEFELKCACKKCGYFTTHNVDFRIGEFDEDTQIYTSVIQFGVKPKQFLLRTCIRCGFKWSEKPVDEIVDEKGANHE